MAARAESTISTQSAAIEAETTLLASILAEGTIEDEEGDIAELLQVLDTVDSVAEGVEMKLDYLLDKLDSLLAVLDPPTSESNIKDELPSDERKSSESVTTRTSEDTPS